VVIEDAAGAPRYMAAVIRGVTIRPSPAWLDARIRSVGARPINNVVDATNYILHEMNQPLHAFDAATVRGKTVIVRKAKPGEHLTTLDGSDRKLTPSMTTICDGEGPIGVAGVMGGANSEMTAQTTDVFLECASFAPASIRATRVALKLNTEASYRYERGIDTQNMGQALRRAVALILAVAGGSAEEPSLDLCAEAPASPTVFLRPGRVTRLLGVDVPRAEIERLLTAVGFTVAPKDDRLAVQVPGWRPDVTSEVDLIEEVARLRGYDSFPSTMHPLRPSVVPDDPIEPLKARVRRVLVGFGLHEARTLTLTSDAAGVPVLNPLASDQSHLRADLVHGLSRGVERNWAARERNVRLFEIGVTFRAEPGTPRPSERWRVGAVMTGARTAPHWADREAAEFDLWDARGMLEETAKVAGLSGAVQWDGTRWTLTDPSGAVLGWAGPVAADAPPWAAPLVGFELTLSAAPAPAVPFSTPPTTPAAERDVALVLGDGVSAEQVEAVVRAKAGALLESLRVFDEYRSKDMAGRSVAWRLVFRAPDRTLKDDEVEAALKKILSALKEQLGVQLRQT
jgi:phenylalanyl-tRNA synthetase beta chain